MNAKITIRLANVDDTEAIREINQQAFGYEFSLAETKKQLKRILSKPEIRIIVAEVNQRVVGYIHGADYDCTYAKPLKNIMAIGVLDEFRGLGIGRRLLDEVENWAKAEGCVGVRLVSGYNRAAAHQFYLRCGYYDRKDQKNFMKIFSS